jgi:archaemetzincin
VSAPSDPAAPWREIAISPLGALPTPVLDGVLAELSRHAEIPCRKAPPLGGPEPDPVPGRDQADADRLLARLEAAAAEDVPLVGLTPRDLGLPLFTFVFGRARLGGRAAVVSLARLEPGRYGLPPDPRLVERRAVAEILHELGHVAGLRHCAEPRCLMRFAASVEAVDLRGLSFCPACAAALPRGLAPRVRPSRGVLS